MLSKTCKLWCFRDIIEARLLILSIYRMDLIKRNLQEVLNPQVLDQAVQEGRKIRVYWGTAPTGKTHCGYLVPMAKIADFLKADCEVVVLLADLHAFLDNMKAPLDVLQYRVSYYERTVKAMLRGIGVPIEKLQFVVGKSYQLQPDYTMDLFKLSNLTSQNSCKRAGAEVVKQTDNPALSGLMYPLMQALDEEYLHVDAQFGGVDQRKIFVLAEEQLPLIGYKKRAHLMNPMVPGLGAGGKMSASDPNSKLDLLDDPTTVKKKIAKAFSAPGQVEGNGLIGFVEYVVFPVSDIKSGEPKFFINRDEKWGGPITYHTIDDLKSDYAADKLSPADLKIGVVDAINEILEPIRKILLEDTEFATIEKKAYPPPEAPQGKKKKVKKIGTKYAGASGKQDKSDESSTGGPTVEDVKNSAEKMDISQ